MSLKNRSSDLKVLFFYIAIALIVVLTDQITKALIVRNLSLHESIPVIPGFFDITYIRNTGAAFGMLAGHEWWRHVFFLCVGLVALVALFYFFYSNRQNIWIVLATSLISGGAIGNLIDRLQHGYVIDFLDFFLGKYHWPAFNIADSAITVGGVILAWAFIFNKGIPSQESSKVTSRT